VTYLPQLAAYRDADGFAALGQYGVLGDGRGVALVAGDGSIDWWATPRLDSPPVFAALLDPQRGGRFELRPVDADAHVIRRYLPDTNLLESTFTTATGTVRVLDSLNSGNAGALPWSELARRLDGISGSVAMRLAVTPGDGLGKWSPWLEATDRGPIMHADGVVMAVRCSDSVSLQVNENSITARFSVSEGERVVVAVLASDGVPLYLAEAQAIDDRIDLSATAWRHWSTQVQWTGERRDQIVRSALALKLLMMARTGAIAAAATTSLPERIGGTKNWDYRYSWVRDTALTIGAMMTCGLQEEVYAAIAWLLRAVRGHRPAPPGIFTQDGTHAPGGKTQ